MLSKFMSLKQQSTATATNCNQQQSTASHQGASLSLAFSTFKALKPPAACRRSAKDLPPGSGNDDAGATKATVEVSGSKLSTLGTPEKTRAHPKEALNANLF